MNTFNNIHPLNYQFLPIVYPLGNVKKNKIGGSQIKSNKIKKDQIQGSEMGESEVDESKVYRKLKDKRQ